MTLERKMQASLAHLEQDVDGFMGAAFVDLESERALAVHSVRPEFDLAAMENAGCVAIRAHLASLKTQCEEAFLEEMIVLVTGYIYVFFMLTKSVFLCLAADRDETNLALVKSVVGRRVAGLAVAMSGGAALEAAAITGNMIG